MIVELIGCAGAGKTTLRKSLCACGITGAPVVAMPDLVLDKPLLSRIAHPTAMNVVQEIASFPFFLAAWRRERDFIAFARRMFSHPGVTTYDKLNGLRGIVRKLGMYHLAAARAPRAIVLSEEGTLLSAYNLFVSTGDELSPHEIETFARLVAMPDRVVYVKAPVRTLVERALTRPDTRRQHRGKHVVDIERDIQRTVELFDLIAATASVRDRITVVDNSDADEAGKQIIAEDIARWLEGSLSIPQPMKHVVGPANLGAWP